MKTMTIHRLTNRHPSKGLAGAAALLLLLAGCATAVKAQHGAHFTARRWVLLPLMNYSETPHADERARAILSTLLRTRGVKTLAEAPRTNHRDQQMPDLDERRRLEEAVAWSKAGGYTVGLTGSVNEWRYRGSSEGSPAVGLSLRVLDIESGDVLWEASGARSGSGGDTVSGTAQQLLADLLGGMESE